jgi:outer membrane biogenesis lipoprotein LolB
MKTIKRLTAILSLFLLTSCGVNWQVATLNHDSIYADENYIVVAGDVEVDTLNAFQFRNKLRTDFNFR